MIVTGLLKVLIGFTGIMITIICLIIYLFKRNPGWVKRAGVTFFSVVAVIVIITLVEFFIYPINRKKNQLVLTAYREAPIGSYWLGLYADSTWEMGYSSREIDMSGIYSIKGDTLELKATSEKGFYNGDRQNSFLINDEDLVEIENTGIRGLDITMNELN